VVHIAANYRQHFDNWTRQYHKSSPCFIDAAVAVLLLSFPISLLIVSDDDDDDVHI